MAQQARDAAADLRNVDELNVYEGAAAANLTAPDEERRKHNTKGLAGALGLGGF